MKSQRSNSTKFSHKTTTIIIATKTFNDDGDDGNGDNGNGEDDHFDYVDDDDYNNGFPQQQQ